VTTALRGNTSEAAVLNALVERDFAVLLPFGEGHPYDLVLHVAAHNFLRVQCKTARVLNGCLRFNSRSTDHGSGPGSYVGLADLFGVYLPSSKSVYLVPVTDVPRFEVFLRIEPARNNQRRRVRLAADYHIDRWMIEDLIGLLQIGNSEVLLSAG
jgi:PD-(D/E)XK endonuclease